MLLNLIDRLVSIRQPVVREAAVPSLPVAPRESALRRDGGEGHTSAPCGQA